MLSKCFKMIRIQLRGIIFSGQFGTKRGHRASRSIATAMILGLISFVFIFYSGLFSMAYIVLGLENTVMPLMMTVASLLILFTTMIKANNFIFSARDNDLLMSLPVKNWTIIVSRFASLYIYEEVITAMVMLPALIVYIFMCRPSVFFAGAVILSVFFIPLIPLAVATLLGIIISFIASRFRYKNFITMILGAVAMLAVMYFSFYMSATDKSKLVQMNQVLQDMVRHIYPPAVLYSDGLTGSVVSYVGYLLISVAVSGIIISVIAFRFNRLCSALSGYKTRGGFKMTELKTGTVFSALLRKEFKRFFSSTIYVLNTGLIYVLLIVGAVAIFFIENIDEALDIPGAGAMIQIFVPLIISFFAGITSTTSVSLSLEGKNLWLLASFPVKSGTVFKAKIVMNLILALPSVLFASVMCMIRFRMDVQWAMIAVIIPVLYSLTAAVGGMFVNIHFPNFVWTNEAAVVKQSASVMVTVFGGMILVFVPGALIFLLGLPAFLVYCVTAVILMAMNIIFYLCVMKTPLIRFCEG